MKPMMPANSTPLAFSTVARGMFPIEPMNVAAATNGATIAFSSAMSQPGNSPCTSLRKIADQNSGGTSTATKPATVKPIRISFQTICQSRAK